MRARVLVTGGSGFIGRSLVPALAEHFEVTAPPRTALDLLDADAVLGYLERGGYDVVVHAATWDATSTSCKDPARVLENNLRMFHSVARARTSFGRLVHLGSGAEYDRGRELLGVREEEFDDAVPADQYGFSKYLVRKHCEASPGVVTLSLFGVFGPYEDWRLRFLSNACCHALLGLPVEVGRDALFDYISVDDVAAAVAWCVANEPSRRSYNVCRGEAVSLLDLARAVIEVAGSDAGLVVHREGRGPSYSGDPSRFAQESGWRPGGLRGQIEALYAWYEQHRDEIDPAMLRGRAWLRTEA